jgi:hypothetical protein
MRWGHTEPVKYFGSPNTIPGADLRWLWEYRPTSRAPGERELNPEGIGGRRLGIEEGKTGVVVYHSPYVIVGGKLDIQGTEPN